MTTLNYTYLRTYQKNRKLIGHPPLNFHICSLTRHTHRMFVRGRTTLDGANGFRPQVRWGQKTPPAVHLSTVAEMYGTLRPRDPKFGTRVHVSKGYPNMHNLGGQKIRGPKFGIFLFSIFLSFFMIRPKILKMTFFENSKFRPP